MKAERILELFDFFRTAPAGLQEEILGVSELVTLPVGVQYFQEGSGCPNVAFVGRGDIRVFKVSRGGREITLYHVTRGETCLLTLNAALSEGSYPASAVAEVRVEAVVVPVDRFRSWVERYDPIRAYVFGEMAHRIADLMALIHEVVFRRMDRRLADYLLRRFEAQGSESTLLGVTHGSIAGELGSAREVVSRVLKELEREGAVRLGRGRIHLTDKKALRGLARPPGGR